MRLSYRFLVAVVALCLILGETRAGAGQPPRTQSVQVTTVSGGVTLVWQGRVSADDAGAPWLADWPEVEIGGYRLPARLVALQVAENAQIIPQFEVLSSAPWSGALPTAQSAIPETVAGEPRPALARSPARRLPGAPVVILREGRLRGTRVVVLAITPIYEADGKPRAITELRATLPAATLLDVDAAALLAHAPPFLASAPGPNNPAATVPSVTLTVAREGIQRVAGAALADAGVSLAAAQPALMRLWRNGAEVALELRGADDGRLDPDDQLRFYAPAPGDRWNATDTYWLTQEITPTLRMASRIAITSTAPITTTALQFGDWRAPQVYDSHLPGPSGTHWYAADLRTGPGQPLVAITVPMTTGVPLATGVTAITVTGSAYTAELHHLLAETENLSQTLVWRGIGDWTQTFTTTDRAEQLRLTLLPDAAADGVLLERVTWQRPITLDAGGDGLIFDSSPAPGQVQIGGTLPGQTLYDISDPARPVVVAFDASAPGVIQTTPGQRYLLTGAGTESAPAVALHSPIKLAAPLDADALYIAPAVFKNALAPLVALRGAQGHAVQIVDVQAIYDSWSYGQVAPHAIRDFLRYAAATWTRTPCSVTLVGDGTSDPLNYTGRNNTNFIPPYLAMVDPWLGETACDTCYGQLDGADPLEDPLPDLMVGRLPVKSAAETASLVVKIVGYETAAASVRDTWRSRGLFVADNYQDAAGVPDEAGDFPTFADASVALQPAWLGIERLYYDPSPVHAGVLWREPDAVTAYRRTLALLNAGAGLAEYVGHAHHWQWAVTDLAAAPSYLLGLYDADALTNGARLPILLEMTCLTSAFQQPAYSGTTIDERLLLHPGGGAVAIWGPTGLGLLHGHDALRRGFYTALWHARPGAAVVGELTAAGYLALFVSGGGSQEGLRTFVLLGDPLTRTRVFVPRAVYLPLIRRTVR